MEDLGDPISYLTLEKGTAVYSADGEKIGSVAEIQADEGSDIFDSIVLDRNSILPGGREEIPADEIDEIYERGVVLSAGAGSGA
jgi:sporulation protein YlmC with PRC-barrel domain